MNNHPDMENRVLTSGIPKTAFLLATLKSQDAAISNPAPSAYPFTRAITGTGHSRIARQVSETLEMKLRAADGESRDAISAMSAPPINALEPAPVKITARRAACDDVIDFMVDGRERRMGVLRAFSFEGRDIVKWAIVPVPFGRRVMVFRIWAVISLLR